MPLRGAFKRRHKLQDAYGREPYAYSIRPVNGGKENTVNRKYLRLDPLALVESGDETYSGDDSDWDVQIMHKETLPVQNAQDSTKGVGTKTVREPLCDSGSRGETQVRRSQRCTRGHHRNPYRLPCSSLR